MKTETGQGGERVPNHTKYVYYPISPAKNSGTPRSRVIGHCGSSQIPPRDEANSPIPVKMANRAEPPKKGADDTRAFLVLRSSHRFTFVMRKGILSKTGETGRGGEMSTIAKSS